MTFVPFVDDTILYAAQLNSALSAVEAEIPAPLVAGSGITIAGDVISSSGGGTATGAFTKVTASNFPLVFLTGTDTLTDAPSGPVLRMVTPKSGAYVTLVGAAKPLSAVEADFDVAMAVNFIAGSAEGPNNFGFVLCNSSTGAFEQYCLNIAVSGSDASVLRAYYCGWSNQGTRSSVGGGSIPLPVSRFTWMRLVQTGGTRTLYLSATGEAGSWVAVINEIPIAGTPLLTGVSHVGFGGDARDVYFLDTVAQVMSWAGV